MKYRKKPVVIEALQWNNKNALEDIKLFVGNSLEIDIDGDYYIKTLEGNMYLKYLDYIIKGIQGEFYPCKPEIFELSYEVAE